MRVDASLSVYQEDETARSQFSRRELNRLRCLLRRLRFLEDRMREQDESNDGARWTAWEADALEWILHDVGFLSETRVAPATLTGSK